MSRIELHAIDRGRVERLRVRLAELESTAVGELDRDGLLRLVGRLEATAAGLLDTIDRGRGPRGGEER